MLEKRFGTWGGINEHARLKASVVSPLFSAGDGSESFPSIAC
jgi:hypothetical protein